MTEVWYYPVSRLVAIILLFIVLSIHSTPIVNLADYVSLPIVEISYPANDALLMHTNMQIEIEMRMHFLTIEIESPRLCISVHTVHTPEDIEQANVLEESCIDPQGNYTNFQVAGLVPGFQYAVHAALSNHGSLLAHSVRRFNVASLVVPQGMKRPDGSVEMVRMGILTAMEVAIHFHQLGDREFAMALYRAVIQLFPNHVPAILWLGVGLLQTSSIKDALPYIEKALALNTTDANIHIAMGMTFHAFQQQKQSIYHFEKALELNPDCIEATLRLGEIWHRMGKWEQAMKHFRSVIATSNDKHCQIALTHHDHEGVVNEAMHRLCELLRVSDGWNDAERCFADAISRWPNDAELHNERGHLLLQAGQFESALMEYEQAVALGSLEGRINVADILEALGEHEESIAHYQAILEDPPDDFTVSTGSRIAIMKTTVLPRILPQTQLSIDIIRANMIKDMTTIIQQLPEVRPIEIDPTRIAFSTAITMNAHNHNNFDFKRYVGVMYYKLFIQHKLIKFKVPSYKISPPVYWQQTRRSTVATKWKTKEMEKDHNRPRRIRVGFVSRFFFNPAVGLYMNELLPQLDTDRFEIYVFCLGFSKSIRVMERMEQLAENMIALPRDLDIARQEIQRLKLDVLIYPELGMDKTTYFLSFYRLAVYQAVWWGNPETSGVPTIDYYLNAEYESQEAYQGHYSEKNFMMSGMGIFHTFPPLPEPTISREDVRMVIQERFNLDDNFHFYLSIESTLHMHPDFDLVLRDILNQDPFAHIFLLGSSNRKRWKTKLLARIEARIGVANIGRVSFFNDVDAKQELSLLQAADVVLASIHLTRPRAAIQAFTAGVPVVTLVGEMWHTRITYGFYRRMGMMEVVTRSLDEYVSMAVRLGNDIKFRETVTRQVRALRDRLSQDDLAISSWESFIQMVGSRVLADETKQRMMSKEFVDQAPNGEKKKKRSNMVTQRKKTKSKSTENHQCRAPDLLGRIASDKFC